MYRNTYAEIRIENLQNNVKEILKKYPEYKYYIGVVKGNCYGHGNKCVKYLVESGINYLAVSSLEEAIEIRNDGVSIPILCLEPIDVKYIDICIKYNVTITINSEEYFKDLIDLDLKNKIKVHLKIDSGMCRLGLNSIEQVNNVFNQLQENENIELEGIYTHFATDGIYDVSWDNQIKRFKELTSEIDLSKIKIVHLGRSQTLLNHNKISFANGIRLGIILFGYNTTPKPLPDDFLNKLRKYKRKLYNKKHNISPTITNIEIDLKPAFSLYSEVIQINDVKKGSFIGYGRTCEAKENMKVAVIPIGYADGFNQRNRERTIVINSKKYSLIGEINMGMVIAKIDENVKLGDKVTLIGDGISVREVARHLETSAYEVPCMLNDWVPRVITKNGKVLETEERKI